MPKYVNKEVVMYINTFRYTPRDVDCKLCTEYAKNMAVVPDAARGLPSAWKRVLLATNRLCLNPFP